ncbi:hypothetical protein K470DRAFT_209822 [Piedraia hortae CBS 480.64]|uniref:Nuclear localization protein n=1 Tax=Piedraia hortae CBS 480.64 TaxID=1314780 RepID=A0A6A7C8Z8_9PEZI|nr:hypothetical protein K470DRAFT_209822 [Piedraia hortae CBS 480.64]
MPDTEIADLAAGEGEEEEDVDEEEDARASQAVDDDSESGTAAKRGSKNVRKGRGTGRGGRKRGRVDTGSAVVLDKDGQAAEVIDDEVQVDDDAEGNTKVDELGRLQGGREYRVRTFTVGDKGPRLYMLSTEPARCCGFRDSYLFFAKHPKLYKVVLGEEQKKDLIERAILPNSYRGRNIAVVTARSVFKEFGARIIVGGRRIIDDYKVAEAREAGFVEGELADPEDIVPADKNKYNRNRYVAWHGASDVYRTSMNVNAHNKQTATVKRKSHVTRENWQLEHAKEASRFNSRLTTMRRANQNGIYDVNTNLMFYPQTMQPTHAKWERVTNSSNSTFPPLPEKIPQNFFVADMQCLGAPQAGAGYPGPDGHIRDVASGNVGGLCGIADEIIAELPPSCRKAFLKAKKVEQGWKNYWSTETTDAHRQDLIIGLNGYPL